jgi:hypothetical protein
VPLIAGTAKWGREGAPSIFQDAQYFLGVDEQTRQDLRDKLARAKISVNQATDIMWVNNLTNEEFHQRREASSSGWEEKVPKIEEIDAVYNYDA